MQDVIVAVDPAKRSHTVEVLDGRERVLATLRVENTNDGYRELRAFVKKWLSRRWAVEGAKGVGRQLAQRLVADGERVIDVPSKLCRIDHGHLDGRTAVFCRDRESRYTLSLPNGSVAG